MKDSFRGEIPVAFVALKPGREFRRRNSSTTAKSAWWTTRFLGN